MRIGIDGRFYGLGSAGLARYTQELLAALTRLGSGHTFVVFVREEDAADVPDLPNVEWRTTRSGHYTLAEQTWFGRELAAAKLDLVHFVNFNHPVRYKGPFVVTIHDLTLLRFPGRHRLWRVKTPIMRAVVRSAAHRSRLVLTSCEYQRGLISEEFGVADGRIRVVPLGVDARFKPLAAREATEFRKAKGLTDPFIMYTGQWRQHKNLERLVHAFAQVRATHQAKLVFVGKIDPAFPEVPRAVQEMGLADDVVFTDFVADDELPKYYSAADIFAFPSLTEGFGLPPVEAISSGTTVAASNAAPMPEILGDAAAYYDPYSVDDMATVLAKLLDDPTERARLAKLGLERAKRYTWDEAARQTLAVYEEAVR